MRAKEGRESQSEHRRVGGGGGESGYRILQVGVRGCRVIRIALAYANTHTYTHVRTHTYTRTHLRRHQCLLLHISGQSLLNRGYHHVGKDGGEAATGADLKYSAEQQRGDQSD